MLVLFPRRGNLVSVLSSAVARAHGIPRFLVIFHGHARMLAGIDAFCGTPFDDTFGLGGE